MRYVVRHQSFEVETVDGVSEFEVEHAENRNVEVLSVTQTPQYVIFSVVEKILLPDDEGSEPSVDASVEQPETASSDS